ncbi:MAG: D-glycero-beta-D-manno-heptose 1-phosphate adenylyltransferase [candidate division FCPU426 bacterium]
MEIILSVPRNAADKILGRAGARERVQEWRNQQRRVVFTNGCFDLLHPGHVRYLAAARRLGDALVVGLNTDASVRRIKGPQRPIQSEAARAEVLASLECVDLVVLFDENDPAALIAELQPQVLVKGADWAKDKVIGRETVEAAGGQVVTIPLVEGESSTHLIERILSGQNQPPSKEKKA